MPGLNVATPEKPPFSASKWTAKKIPTRERLIFALDTTDFGEAKRIVEMLGDQVHFYKIGLQLFMTGHYFDLVDWLGERGKQTFVDLKFFDVPETVAAAVRQLKDQHAAFVTVHGNEDILQAACRERNGLKILAVTALTSLDNKDLHDLGYPDTVDPKQLVLSRARRALAVGCEGVISSGLEVKDLRREFGDAFIIVVPGIRPIENKDDHKRTVDVEEAFDSGADYIVVGRPIARADDPAKAAESIQKRISAIFEA